MLKIFPSSGSSELFRGWLESFPALEKTVQACMLSRVWLFCDPMVCSPPGSSVHGILQARMLEWVAISSSRDLPNPGIEPRSPALQADFFTVWATREAEEPFSFIKFFIKFHCIKFYTSRSWLLLDSPINRHLDYFGSIRCLLSFSWLALFPGQKKGYILIQ